MKNPERIYRIVAYAVGQDIAENSSLTRPISNASLYSVMDANQFTAICIGVIGVEDTLEEVRLGISEYDMSEKWGEFVEKHRETVEERIEKG